MNEGISVMHSGPHLTRLALLIAITGSLPLAAYGQSAPPGNGTTSTPVPGFKPVSAPALGQNAFIGTVTQGDETHIGLGTLQGTLIVGATLVGYDPTPDNIAKLVSVTREEEAAAKSALDRKAQD
jgi:hypothetical protein